MAIEDIRSQQKVERGLRNCKGESQSQWSFGPFYREQSWEERKELTQVHFEAKFVYLLSSEAVSILNINNTLVRNMDKILCFHWSLILGGGTTNEKYLNMF